MKDVQQIAVQIAMLEKAHRRDVLELMAAGIGDVERISRVLALEAEHQGIIEKLRSAAAAAPVERQDDLAADRT